MPQTDRLLNRLLALHYRSFASYLADADPWKGDTPADEEFARTLGNIIAGHRMTSERIAAFLLDRQTPIDTASYPMEFTDKNFLSIDYLIRELLEYQRRDVVEIERIVAGLKHDPAACELAQEALGSAKAYLDALTALAAKQPA